MAKRASKRDDKQPQGKFDRLKNFIKRRWRLIVLAAGISIITLLIVQVGPGKLLSIIERLGWAIVLLVFFPFALQQAGFLAGWWLTFPPDKRPPLNVLILPFLAGEAANAFTGSAEIGGEPIKAAFITRREGLSEAGASVLEARTLRIIAQLIFVVGGLIATLSMKGLPQIVELPLIIGLSVLTVGVGIFVWLQQRQLLTRTVKAVQTTMEKVHIKISDTVREKAANIDQQVAKSYARNKRAAILSTAVQLAAWVVMGAEPYLVVLFLGKRLSAGDGILLEALTLGISTVFFFIPMGLGVADASRALLFQSFGLDQTMGLSWSIVRRVAELTWAGIGFAVINYLKRKRDRHEDEDVNAA